MILKMYSVYDIKSKIYHPPCLCHNAGHATRMFTSTFSKPGSVMHDFPSDFQIFEIGAFDDQTAVIETLINPTLICSVSDLIIPTPEETT